MTRNDCQQREVIFFETVGCCKWCDHRSVTILLRKIEQVIATSHSQKPKKISIKSSSTIPRCFQNTQPRSYWVDLVIKEQLPIILIIYFHKHILLLLFFDLMDVACANSLIVYNIMHANMLTPLYFKVIICTYLIGCYKRRYRAQAENEIESKRKYQ